MTTRTTCPACVIYGDILGANPKLSPIEILAFGVAVGWCGSCAPITDPIGQEFELQRFVSQCCDKHRPAYIAATETSRRLSLQLTDGPTEAEAAAFDARRNARRD